MASTLCGIPVTPRATAPTVAWHAAALLLVTLLALTPLLAVQWWHLRYRPRAATSTTGRR